MGQNNQKLEQIIEVISENAGKELKVRDMTKLTKIPRTSISRYLKTLRKLKVIDKENKLIINNYTKFLRSAMIIEKLYTIGLIGYLEAKLVPSVIIIFGSARKGEHTKESDIDLFVETTKSANLDLSTFEKKIKHKIQLFTEQEIEKLPKELFNNVVNGIKLSGYLRLRIMKKAKLLNQMSLLY